MKRNDLWRKEGYQMVEPVTSSVDTREITTITIYVEAYLEVWTDRDNAPCILPKEFRSWTDLMIAHKMVALNHDPVVESDMVYLNIMSSEDHGNYSIYGVGVDQLIYTDTNSGLRYTLELPNCIPAGYVRYHKKGDKIKLVVPTRTLSIVDKENKPVMIDPQINV